MSLIWCTKSLYIYIFSIPPWMSGLVNWSCLHAPLVPPCSTLSYKFALTTTFVTGATSGGHQHSYLLQWKWFCHGEYHGACVGLYCYARYVNAVTLIFFFCLVKSAAEKNNAEINVLRTDFNVCQNVMIHTLILCIPAWRTDGTSIICIKNPFH